MSEIFDDLFGEFMGGRRTRGRSSKERGSDLKYNMEISLGGRLGKTAQISRSGVRYLRCLWRNWRGIGIKPYTCPSLPRLRQSPRKPRLLHD